MTHDVIVIGAGPAGSAAALALGRAGARVHLIEKNGFPRHKACGDGLTPRAICELENLGVVLDAVPAISGIRVESSGEDHAPALREFRARTGAVVSRFVLDERLAMDAVRAGVDLRDGSLVEEILVEGDRVVGVAVRTTRGARELLRAPITILAEGSVGNLRRQLPFANVRGRQRAFAVRRYFEDVVWGERAEFEIKLPLELDGLPVAGYAWIFPMADGRANVGVGFLADVEPQARLDDVQAEFETTLLRSDPRFTRARRAGPALGAPVAIGGSRTATQHPGILLVGDAVGLANPFWAEGISGALSSGLSAAAVASEVLAGAGSLADYGDRLERLHPTFSRLARSLPAIYRNARHYSRDLVPFLAQRGLLAQAILDGMDSPGGGAVAPVSECSPSAELVGAIRARAYRLAGRDRPLFLELIDALKYAESAHSLIADFVVARAEEAAFDPNCPHVRRIGVVLELLRMACRVFHDVPALPDDFERHERRGGAWMTATVSLSLGDRLLARCFALTSRLPDRERRVVSRALLDVTEQSAALAVQAQVAPDWSKIEAFLRGAAKRVAKQIARSHLEPPPPRDRA